MAPSLFAGRHGSIPRRASVWRRSNGAPGMSRKTSRCSRTSRSPPTSSTPRALASAASISPRSAWTTLPAAIRDAISSGQRQRVALARALAAEPALLLLDEPLSALDAAARARTRQKLRNQLLTSGVPCIVVTHDRMEAIALGDWIAVMVEGRVRQCGPVQEVFQRPADSQVAESVGVENVLPARIVSRHAGLLTIETGGAHLQAVDSREGGVLAVCIRAEDVAITREPATPSSVRNRLPGRVTSVTLGRSPGAGGTRLRLSAGGADYGAIGAGARFENRSGGLRHREDHRGPRGGAFGRRG